MPGKVLINGTAYSVNGGKTLISGTGYSIKQGRVLIDGTVYSIAFGKTFTVSGSSTENDMWGVAVLNGTAKSKDGTYSISDSDSLQVYLTGASSSYDASCKVYLNGTLVKSGKGYYTISNPTQYKSITIKFTRMSNYVLCNITTT